MRIILLALFAFNLFAQSGVTLLRGSGVPAQPSGFDPSDLSPVVDLRYGVGMTKDGTSGNVTSWTDGTYTFANSDTATAPQDFGDKLFFVTSGTRYLSRNNTDDVFDLTEAQDFSIELWVYVTGVGRIFTNRQSGTPYWNVSAFDNDGAKLGLQMHNGTTPIILRADSVAIMNGWHHFVVTVDWAVGIDIYIDAVLKYTDHTATWTGFTTAGQSEPTYIGRSDNAEGFGYWSDLRLYHTALTQTNIDDLFAFGRSQ